MILSDAKTRPPREEQALVVARRELVSRNALEIAQRAGVAYRGLGGNAGVFELACLGRPYCVGYPDGRVEPGDAGAPPKAALALLILHYLLHADGHPLADRWAAFRELPAGLIYDQAFRGRVEPPLRAAFGSRSDAFRRAARASGGYAIAFGDAAFMFEALPRVRLAMILYEEDDEFPADVKVLFDAAAGHYLPTEDLAVLGGMLVGVLLKAQPPKD
jgi:hypothetical protein